MTSLLVTSASVLLYYVIRGKQDPGHGNLPPGRLGWPVLGETIEFIINVSLSLPSCSGRKTLSIEN